MKTVDKAREQCGHDAPRLKIQSIHRSDNCRDGFKLNNPSVWWDGELLVHGNGRKEVATAVDVATRLLRHGVGFEVVS